MQLILYTTSNCHLCEHAEALITKLESTVELIRIEIAENDALISLYGTRIPVLKRSDNLTELSWPFTLHDITAFITF